MVYCDRCGAKADPRDRYCRICGRSINRPPRLWKAQQRTATPLLSSFRSARHWLVRGARSEPIAPSRTRSDGNLDDAGPRGTVLEQDSTTNRKLDVEPHFSAEPEKPLTEATTEPRSRQAAEEPKPDLTAEDLLNKIGELEREKETINRSPTLWEARHRIATPLVSRFGSVRHWLVRGARSEPLAPSRTESDDVSPAVEAGPAAIVLEHPSATNRKVTHEAVLGVSGQLGNLLTEVITEPPSPQAAEETKPDHTPEDLLTKIKELEKEKESLRVQVWRDRKRPSKVAGYGMAGIGSLCLILSVVFASTVLAFIGLGLTFWGVLLLFSRPQKYVRSDLMDSTALSSLTTIDRLIVSLGYNEKGIYIPTNNPEKTVVFIPSQPVKQIPKAEQLEKQTFVKDPTGIAMVPPGLALANLFERELGVKFSKCSLQTLSERLPKLLIEDLEMVRDLEMHIDGDNVRFKLVESAYSDFCRALRDNTRVCASLGCPMCSAMACVLAQASGRPVEFVQDNYSIDGRTIETSYRILKE